MFDSLQSDPHERFANSQSLSLQTNADAQLSDVTDPRGRQPFDLKISRNGRVERGNEQNAVSGRAVESFRQPVSIGTDIAGDVVQVLYDTDARGDYRAFRLA